MCARQTINKQIQKKREAVKIWFIKKNIKKIPLTAKKMN